MLSKFVGHIQWMGLATDWKQSLLRSCCHSVTLKSSFFFYWLPFKIKMSTIYGGILYVRRGGIKSWNVELPYYLFSLLGSEGEGGHDCQNFICFKSWHTESPHLQKSIGTVSLRAVLHASEISKDNESLPLGTRLKPSIHIRMFLGIHMNAFAGFCFLNFWAWLISWG